MAISEQKHLYNSPKIGSCHLFSASYRKWLEILYNKGKKNVWNLKITTTKSNIWKKLAWNLHRRHWVPFHSRNIFQRGTFIEQDLKTFPNTQWPVHVSLNHINFPVSGSQWRCNIWFEEINMWLALEYSEMASAAVFLSQISLVYDYIGRKHRQELFQQWPQQCH